MNWLRDENIGGEIYNNQKPRHWQKRPLQCLFRYFFLTLNVNYFCQQTASIECRRVTHTHTSHWICNGLSSVNHFLSLNWYGIVLMKIGGKKEIPILCTRSKDIYVSIKKFQKSFCYCDMSMSPRIFYHAHVSFTFHFGYSMNNVHLSIDVQKAEHTQQKWPFILFQLRSIFIS